MKKRISTLLLISLSSLLVSCGQVKETVAPHRHTFTTYWDSNSQSHFHICTFPGCGLKANVGEHTFSNEEAYDEEYKMYKYCSFCGHREFTGEILPEFRVDNLPEIYYSYPDSIKEYLEMEEPDPHGYQILGYRKGFRPLTINWLTRREGVTKYEIEYADNQSFTNSKVIQLESEVTSYYVYNLFKDRQYYFKVTQYYGNNSKDSKIVQTRTTDKGPRLVRIPQISNTRDIGGYKTASGTTVQGLAYRGTTLSGSGLLLNDEGQEIFKELGVKTELEFRPESEAGNFDQVAHINNANFVRCIIDGYESAFNVAYKDAYKNVFKLFANKDNYPIYFHCAAGADRTGTVAFIINALLGVEEIDLIHDFELTSFYEPGERNYSHIYPGVANCADHMTNFVNMLNQVEGTSFVNKIENFLLNNIGITAEDINNIRDIFFGRK